MSCEVDGGPDVRSEEDGGGGRRSCEVDGGPDVVHPIKMMSIMAIKIRYGRVEIPPSVKSIRPLQGHLRTVVVVLESLFSDLLFSTNDVVSLLFLRHKEMNIRVQAPSIVVSLH